MPSAVRWAELRFSSDGRASGFVGEVPRGSTSGGRPTSAVRPSARSRRSPPTGRQRRRARGNPTPSAPRTRPRSPRPERNGGGREGASRSPLRRAPAPQLRLERRHRLRITRSASSGGSSSMALLKSSSKRSTAQALFALFVENARPAFPRRRLRATSSSGTCPSRPSRRCRSSAQMTSDPVCLSRGTDRRRATSLKTSSCLPMRMRSPAASGCEPWINAPLTRQPLRLPRSSRTARSPNTRILACRREIEGIEDRDLAVVAAANERVARAGARTPGAGNVAGSAWPPVLNGAHFSMSSPCFSEL